MPRTVYSGNQYPFRAEPNAYRRDTAPILPEFGLADFFDALNQRGQSMRIFTEKEKQRLEKEYLDFTDFTMDPGLTDPDFQKPIIESLKRLESNTMQTVKDYGYNLPMEEKLKIRNAQNAIRARQQAYLQSQQLHDQAAVKIRENPHLYDIKAFEAKEKEFRENGKPVFSWLEFRGNSPENFVMADIRSQFDFTDTETRHLGGKEVTEEYQMIKNMTDEEKKARLVELFDANPLNRKGVVEEFMAQPEEVRAKYTGENGPRNYYVDKYLPYYQKKHFTGKRTSPLDIDPETGVPNYLKNKPEINYNQEYLSDNGFYGGWQWPEDPLKLENIQLPEQVEKFINKTDEENPGQGVKDASFNGIVIGPDGNLLVEVYLPKQVGMNEKEIREQYADNPNLMRIYLKQLKNTKDQFKVNRLYLPYMKYKDVIKRNRRFGQDPEQALARLTLAGVFANSATGPDTPPWWEQQGQETIPGPVK